MNKKPYCVHVIVDSNYGERLHSLPEGEPAWVVDSEVNHPIIQALWKKAGKTSHINGITSFRFDPKGSAEDWFISEVNAIDLHHGEFSHNPPYSVLNVIGVNWSDRIEKELREFGFTEHEPTAEGFKTRRAPG